MKVKLTLVLLCFLFSCQIRYEDNERLFLKGKLANNDNAAVANIPIEIYASNIWLNVFEVENLNSRNFFEDVDLIGNGLSAANGSYGITAISPQGEPFLVAYINRADAENYNTKKPSIVIYDLNTIPNDEITYNLPLATLSDIIPFEIRVERKTNLTDTLVFSASFPRLNRILNIPDISNQQINNQFLNKVMLPTTSQTRDTLQIVEGDLLTLNYTLKNRTIISSGEEQIKVSATNNQYVFEF